MYMVAILTEGGWKRWAGLWGYEGGDELHVQGVGELAVRQHTHTSSPDHVRRTTVAPRLGCHIARIFRESADFWSTVFSPLNKIS